MKYKVLFLFFAFFAGCLELGAQQWPDYPLENGSRSPSYLVRYEPAIGCPPSLRAKSPDGRSVVVRNRYVAVDRAFVDNLERKGCATFWYEVFSSDGEHRVLRARTKRFSVGVAGMYWFGGSPLGYGGWQNGVMPDGFQGASCREWNYSAGLHLGVQLFAANRHRFSVELLPAYHRTVMSFALAHYQTSYPAVDPDGGTYERMVTVENYRERAVGHVASLPVNLRYDWYFLKKVSVFIAGGIDNRLLVGKRSAADFDARYAGQYGPEMFNILIDQNGYYDFGVYPGVHLEHRGVQDGRYSLFGTATAGLQFFLGNTVSLDVAGVYGRLLYRTGAGQGTQGYCLSADAGTFQSMGEAVGTDGKGRFGVNVRLKVNF